MIKSDQPVAFATNSLFALEMNGARDQNNYEKILFPLIKAKAEYLSLEGVSGALWAFS